MVHGPIFGDGAYHRRQRNSEAKWSVIANGRSIANGTTIRRDGVVSVSVVTPRDDEQGILGTQVNKHGCENDKKETENDEPIKNNSGGDTKKKKRPVLKINTSGARASANEALSTVLHQLKWRESKTSLKSGLGADVYWHGLGFEESAYNKRGVYAVNKLPGMFELAQKVNLSRIIKRMQLLFPGEFDFYPPTWFLPEQYHQFLAEVTMKNKSKSKPNSNPNSPGRGSTRSPHPSKKRKERNTYIVKPDAGSQGEGIYLVNDPRDVQDFNGRKPAIIQKYIDDPLLIDGYKFDLRMYVVVARLNPVEIYLCKDGLARLCTEEYEAPTAANIHKTYMHLTNYSLNKFSSDFVYTDAEGTGSKRSYRSVKQLLRKKGYDVVEIEDQIKTLVVKTILSMLPDITIWEHVTNKSKLVRSFQILGFDILLSSDLRAHLLEVNSAPSMCIDGEQENEEGLLETITSHVDEQIKVPLLRDSLRLIAYGENEVNMEKSCLERVYPNHSTSGGVSPRKGIQEKKNNGQSGKNHPETARSLPRREVIRKEIRDLEEKIKAQLSVVEKYKQYYENREATSSTPKESFQEYGNDETDIPLSSRSLPAPTRLNRCYSHDTPQPQLARTHYATRRSKGFTVIKYKQEYAISNDEWRLFDPKRKPWQRLSLHPSAQRSSTVLPSVERQQQQQQRQKKQPEKQLDVEMFKTLPKCKLCGSFVSGAGPGLYYAQQEYKSLTEENDDKLPASVTPLDGVAEHSDVFLDAEDDWESDRANFGGKMLPLRSIYFGEAAQEEEEDFLQRRQRLWQEEKRAEEEREAQAKKECHEVVDLLCDNCYDVGSITSSEYDVEPPKLGALHGSRSLHSGIEQEPRESSSTETKSLRRKPFAMREVMLLNRAAAVFIFFNGIKPSLRISATAFRNMARRCRLCEQGAMPSIDILFIDTMRQWQNYTHERSSPFYDSHRGRNPVSTHQPPGLPFQGFLEALFKLAQSRFRGETLKEKLEALISNCELYIREVTKADKKRSLQPPQTTPRQVSTTPRVSGSMSQRRLCF